MADRRNQPQQQTSLAASAAFFLMSVAIGAPAIAASAKQNPCPGEALVADLEVPVEALVSQFVNNDIPDPATSLLAPLAEAAIREAFDEQDNVIVRGTTNLTKATAAPPMAGTESNVMKSLPNEDDNGIPAEHVPDMNTRLPGVSDEALSRYKKQMYRRDI